MLEDLYGEGPWDSYTSLGINNAYHYCPVFSSRCEALLRNVACLPAECAFYMIQEGFQAALGNQKTKPNIGRICQDE